MDSVVLSLLLALLFNLALASSPHLGTTPSSPCAAICNTAVRDDTFICKGGDLEGTGIEGCLTCLQESEHTNGKEEYLAELLTSIEAACPERPHPRSLYQQPTHQIHRRAPPTPLPKPAIAGIALGAALILTLAASLAYLAHRKYTRRTKNNTSPRSWKGPPKTTSSLDFRCRTRVTPMASRADFRRISKEGERGVRPGDALGSNPVLEGTLDESTTTPPATPTESLWNGQTMCSETSPPATTIKWMSPAVPEPRTPAPAYSPHRISPYTLPSATPSSTRSDAPLLAARIYTPPEHASASPSTYRSGGSGYGALYPPGGIWEGPARALRTQRGGWDLHARSVEEGSGCGLGEDGRDMREYESGVGVRDYGVGGV